MNDIENIPLWYSNCVRFDSANIRFPVSRLTLKMGLAVLRSHTMNAANPMTPMRIIHIPWVLGNVENPYMRQNSMMQNKTEPTTSYVSPFASAHSLRTLVNSITSATN